LGSVVSEYYRMQGTSTGNPTGPAKTYDYDAYGNPKGANAGTPLEKHSYRGYFKDGESGLYYLNARYYDSQTGQFLQEDPIRYGQNHYSYCSGDPVNRWDPSGLCHVIKYNNFVKYNPCCPQYLGSMTTCPRTTVQTIYGDYDWNTGNVTMPSGMLITDNPLNDIVVTPPSSGIGGGNPTSPTLGGDEDSPNTSGGIPILNLQPTLIALLSGALSGFMASIISSIIGLKTAIATSWLPAVCIISAGIAIGTMTYAIVKTVELAAESRQVIAAVKTMIDSGGIDRNNLGNHTVYVITKIENNDVVYVGRTINFKARMAAHGKRFPAEKYIKYPIATNLSLTQARALEQTLITAYGIKNLSNMINSIAKGNLSKFRNELYQMELLIESYFDGL